MCIKKTSIVLIWLVGLSSCQPPPIDFDQDASGYGPMEVGAPQAHQTRRRPPGYYGDAAEQVGVGPAEYDDLDDRQAAINFVVNSLITRVMRFVRPLLSNLGVAASNAILATMLRRRLALIPEARKSMSAVLTHPKLLSATVRASGRS